VADGCKDALDRNAGAQVIPAIGRKIPDGQQRLAVIDLAGCRPTVLGPVFLGADDHGHPGGGAAGPGPPDVVQAAHTASGQTVEPDRIAARLDLDPKRADTSALEPSTTPRPTP